MKGGVKGGGEGLISTITMKYCYIYQYEKTGKI